MASRRLAASKIPEKVTYVGNTTFTLDRNRFSDFKLIGQGSYGVVCSVLDGQLQKKVAIKKITPMAKHVEDARHVLREIRLMRHMGKHENIITLEDLIVRESADELYIIMELLDSDLHRVIQSKQVLTDNHYRYFFFQLLCGVKYLHDHHIIHRDLKPGNLLVTRDCKLRVTDFGLARERPIGLSNAGQVDDDIDEPMTEHVITRWYRPPELMLCPDGLYSYAVDMWSCGCILGEMLGRNPMFPGKNFIHQLTLIFDVIGSPKPSEVKHIKNGQAKKFLDSQISKKPVGFENIFPSAPLDAVDVLESLLHFDPDRRATVDEALKSIYLSPIGKSSISLQFPEVSRDFEFGFERAKVSRAQLKAMIISEAVGFHAEKFGPRDVKPSALSVEKNETQVQDRLSSTAACSDSSRPRVEATLQPKPRATSVNGLRRTEATVSSKSTSIKSTSLSQNYHIHKSDNDSIMSIGGQSVTTVASAATRVSNLLAANVTAQASSLVKGVFSPEKSRDITEMFSSPNRSAGKKSIIISKNTPTKPSSTQQPFSPEDSLVSEIRDKANSPRRSPLAAPHPPVVHPRPSFPSRRVDVGDDRDNFTTQVMSTYYERLHAENAKIADDARAHDDDVVAAAEQNNNNNNNRKEHLKAKKKLTVARSPKFSKMSWERKHEGTVPAAPAEAGEVAELHDNQYRSSSRVRPHVRAASAPRR